MKVIRTGASPGTVLLAEADPPEHAAEVLAAGVNPVDAAIAAGRLPFRRLDEDATLGFDGVARTEEGRVVYFSAPRPPAGSYAERVNLEGAETATVPADLDPVQAAAIGVPGIAAWEALFGAGRFAEGESVIVLGGTGAVGRIAAQLALAHGASVVAATARSAQGRDEVAAIGAVPIDIGSPAAASTQLHEASAEGFDVVIDTLWAEPLVAVIDRVRLGGRIAQVGNSAGAEAVVSAPAFRNRGITIAGHSNFHLTAQQRRRAYEVVADLAARERVNLPVSTISLEEVPDHWARRPTTTGRGRTVVVP